MSVFIPVPKKGNAKQCSNHSTIALISHAIKVILKILQARLQQYVNHELPDIQVELRSARGTRDHIANIHRIIEKAVIPEKHLILLTEDANVTDCVDPKKNCGNFFKGWEYQTTLPAL